MKGIKYIFLIVFLVTAVSSKAYISYSNYRIDHSLYDGHDPKLVVIGKILSRQEIERPKPDTSKGLYFSVWDGPPGPVSIGFKIQHTVMGNKSWKGKTLDLPTLSFEWPQELVRLDTGKTCILIIRVDTYNGKTEYGIEVVIPFNEKQYSFLSEKEKVAGNNNEARLFLEKQIMAELKTEIATRRQQALLEQLGPITSSSNENDLVPFIGSTDEWVKRAALANLVFATQKLPYIQMLALDVNTFFTTYKNQDMVYIGTKEEYSGYSAYYLYYRFVFFLSPDQRKWGSRWDENEARTNEKLVAKLKATGHLSKNVQQEIKC